MPTRFHHFAVEVSDAERSAEFYCSLLGFQRAGEYHFPDRQRTIIMVKLGEVCLEFLQGPGARPHLPQSDMVGYKHTCVLTEDVDGDVERLRAAGVKVTLEPFDTELDSRIAFIEDPDGLPVELWQDQ
jgi:glyoxylase I family protein